MNFARAARSLALAWLPLLVFAPGADAAAAPQKDATLHMRAGHGAASGMSVLGPDTLALRVRVRKCATGARLRVTVGRSSRSVPVTRTAWTTTRLRLKAGESGAVLFAVTAGKRCGAASVDVSSLKARTLTSSVSARITAKPPYDEIFEEEVEPVVIAPVPVPVAAAATPTPTATPTRTATPTPTATPTASPTPTPAATPKPRRWGLIGNQPQRAASERAAGITTKVVRLSWKDLEPQEGQVSSSYVSAKRSEIATLRAAGLEIVLDSGLHDVPAWIHNRPNSYYVNQYGEKWTSATDGDLAIDKGDANLVFNPALRVVAATYLKRIGELFGADAYAIRVGGGRWNELGYPPAKTAAHTNTYWAFDALAQQQSPVPGWKPGNASPNGEAQKFITFYLKAMVDFQQWQIQSVRTAYAGPIMVLYPGWGVRPGQAAGAAADRLQGRTSVEINGELQRGFDWASQVAAINDPKVWPATTWLDAPYGSDATTNQSDWRPPHYLAAIAGPNATVWGENTGGGTAATMTFAAQQAKTYGLAGMVWFREEELFGGGGLATLENYRATIAAGSTS